MKQPKKASAAAKPLVYSEVAWISAEGGIRSVTFSDDESGTAARKHLVRELRARVNGKALLISQFRITKEELVDQ